MSKLKELSKKELRRLVRSQQLEIKYLGQTLDEVIEANKGLVSHSEELVDEHINTMKDMAELIRNLTSD